MSTVEIQTSYQVAKSNTSFNSDNTNMTIQVISINSEF